MLYPKINRFVFFLPLLFLVLPSFVGAIGISPADAYVSFVPNHEYVIDYSITSYRPFEFYTQGAFSEYTRVEKISQSDTQGTFRIYLTLPAEYEKPGKHRMYVAAAEKPTGGVVNALAIIRGFIEIDVPFPGFYAEMTVNVENANAGERIPISANILNRGKLNISDAKVELEVLAGNAVVKSISSDIVPIEKGGGYNFQTEIKGGELKPGRYTLNAELTYEGKQAYESKEFRIGTFDVNIVNHTDTMYNNSINLFEIEVESLWNNRMDTVFMDLNIKDGNKVLSTVKTPPFDLLPWQKHKTSFYWNTAGIDVGEYDLEIILHYDEDVKTENRKIYIIEPPVQEQAMNISLSTVLLLVMALLLIGFNVYFIFGRRKKDNKDKEETSKKQD